MTDQELMFAFKKNQNHGRSLTVPKFLCLTLTRSLTLTAVVADEKNVKHFL